MKKRSLALGKVYGLLEPGPVLLLSTRHKGRANVMAMSWHTMMDFDPPLVGCVVSGRDFSFAALKATRECVLNIPSAELAAKSSNAWVVVRIMCSRMNGAPSRAPSSGCFKQHSHSSTAQDL